MQRGGFDQAQPPLTRDTGASFSNAVGWPSELGEGCLLKGEVCRSKAARAPTRREPRRSPKEAAGPPPRAEKAPRQPFRRQPAKRLRIVAPRPPAGFGRALSWGRAKILPRRASTPKLSKRAGPHPLPQPNFPVEFPSGLYEVTPHTTQDLTPSFAVGLGHWPRTAIHLKTRQK